MDIRIFDQQLNQLGVVDEMASLIWTSRYFKVGEFKILAPATQANKELLRVGNVVSKHDEYIDYTDPEGSKWRRAGEITLVHYSQDLTGMEQIEAMGSMLAGWLNKRVIYPQVQTIGTCQEIVNLIYGRNAGAKASSKRRFPQTTVLTQGAYGGQKVDYSNEELKMLGDEIEDLCQSGKLGFDILICERTKKFGFYLYNGRDYTADNTKGNQPCIFSRDFDNVSEQDYTNSIENVKTFAYVSGADDDAGNRDTVTIDRGGKTGFDLEEVYIDASDIRRTAEDSDGTQTDIPVATYKKMLTTKGDTELDAKIETYSFNSKLNLLSNLRYKEDFDLGDRITCTEKSWGIMINSRITEITQTWEQGQTTIEATFGESAPTLIDKLRKR